MRVAAYVPQGTGVLYPWCERNRGSSVNVLTSKPSDTYAKVSTLDLSISLVMTGVIAVSLI